MKVLVVLAGLLPPVVFAQIDRAGNVIDGDSGGGGDGMAQVITGIVIGAVFGAIYAKHQQSRGKDFATGGGVVMGGLIGMFVWPLLKILLK